MQIIKPKTSKYMQSQCGGHCACDMNNTQAIEVTDKNIIDNISSEIENVEIK